MASTFSKLRSEFGDDMEEQVERLQREVKTLRKALAKRGASAYDETREVASDLYEEIAARISDAAPQIARQSRVVGKAAADNPIATAVVGLAVAGLLYGLLTRRDRPRPRARQK